MQNERSGARKQRKPKDEEVLSPGEAADAADLARGRDLKRIVRAAAALREIYTDTALAKATKVTRGAVLGWWGGAQMAPDTIHYTADATGLSRDELTEYVHYGGPLPRLPGPTDLPVLEGGRRAARRRADTNQDMRPQRRTPRPRDSGAEHA